LILSAAEQIGGPRQIWYLSYRGGEVRRITNDPNDYGEIGLTSDSRSLVALQRDDLSSIWIVRKGDVANARQIITSANRTDGLYGISWTPDNRIVYVPRPSISFEIWTMNPDGSDRRQLTAEGELPRVVPDGHHVVFTSHRSGTPHIWRVDIDGNNLRQLTNGKGEWLADYSSDGKWVVYLSAGFGTNTLWKVASPEGPRDGQPIQLTHENTLYPSFSPDGKLIAFHYEDERASPKSGVAIISFDGGPPIKRFDIEAPVRWTQDSKDLLYVKDQTAGNSTIWSQPIRGGAPRQVARLKTDAVYWFDWSRDGQQLAWVHHVANHDVVLIRDLK